MFVMRSFGWLLFAFCCALALPAESRATVQTKSDVKGVSLVTSAQLPPSPEKAALDQYCDGYRAKKLTTLAKQVAKLGWIVTSEGQFGSFRVVTFVSGFDPGTSGLCFARNANIAMFDGGKLAALAFTPSHSKSPSLGTVEPLEDGGLLVWTDPPGSPLGELHQQGGQLRFTQISPQRTFCDGRAIVPNVYGLPIKVARTALITHGWQPLRPRERPDKSWMEAQLGTDKIIEAESCSGTGVGYCSFNYRNQTGVLGVTTAGDDNRVDRYRVKCVAK